jgi:peroxiredoxin
MSTLKDKLVALRQELEEGLSEDVRSTFQRINQRLIEKDIAGAAAGVGDSFPEFSLPNPGGIAVNSEDFLENGPLVVCFYRGGWCPYCNLELRAFQSIIPTIRQLGADLVAISPQLPDEGLALAAKSGLTFEVLCDTGNSLASHLGLVVELPKTLVDIYLRMGIDLDRINGSSQWSLPMPATYVVDTDNAIIDAFVHPDYRMRREPEYVLEVLRGLQF